ncbi:hypothetical protein K7472_20265 [Streptomyces sp. PTM05]|uniref:Uncharacterized protein n=1 Tax=Streptantibioticus parmotrematis TaxID=2873249 RepID=A0ABS7QVD8_9ACTN|nr:hypothetical protein [Streptantibioticus parmotrematis]MBY8887165.1 hypothetical protein [Streptantibioticus parmotrematis]
MAFGFAPKTRLDTVPSLTRTLDPDEWEDSAVPLLGNPREVVKELCDRHLPSPGSAVVAVFDPDGRACASASFTQRATRRDGWEHRNAILANLRRVIPHDLRLRAPVRTTVLLVCRDGTPGWTEADGAWMWGLRDACTLHGLRCGAYVTLTRDGWQVLGDGRGGRTPHSGSWAERASGHGTLRSPVGAPEGVRRQVAR